MYFIKAANDYMFELIKWHSPKCHDHCAIHTAKHLCMPITQAGQSFSANQKRLSVLGASIKRWKARVRFNCKCTNTFLHTQMRNKTTFPIFSVAAKNDRLNKASITHQKHILCSSFCCTSTKNSSCLCWEKTKKTKLKSLKWTACRNYKFQTISMQYAKICMKNVNINQFFFHKHVLNHQLVQLCYKSCHQNI